MGKREKFKEISVKTDDTPASDIKLTYYLLTDSVREEYCDLMVYGAEIDKEAVFGGGVKETESKIIKNLFFRKQEAEDFLDKLARNQVTPMGLKPAISEHIGEQIKLLACEE